MCKGLTTGHSRGCGAHKRQERTTPHNKLLLFEMLSSNDYVDTSCTSVQEQNTFRAAPGHKLAQVQRSGYALGRLHLGAGSQALRFRLSPLASSSFFLIEVEGFAEVRRANHKEVNPGYPRRVSRRTTGDM